MNESKKIKPTVQTAPGTRRWEPLNGRMPRVGDEVRQDYCGVTATAVVARVDDDGSPWTAEGRFIGRARVGTWYVRRPATPPADEVELPGEHPAHLTDVVETEGGDHTAYAALDVDGDWCGVGQDGYLNTLRPTHIAAFTLPDGTRARRDGDRPDGTPRFVKAGEGDQ